MCDDNAKGPPIPDEEDLYRAITTSEWIHYEHGRIRISSFAFKVRSPFSANRTSRITLEQAIEHMRQVLNCPDGGIARFNCGEARKASFDAREEPDPAYPQNTAHANVYYVGTCRKRDARRLAEQCVIEHEPRFVSPHGS